MMALHIQRAAKGLKAHVYSSPDSLHSLQSLWKCRTNHSANRAVSWPVHWRSKGASFCPTWAPASWLQRAL